MVKIFLPFISVFLLFGCVGPTTPLGAVDNSTKGFNAVSDRPIENTEFHLMPHRGGIFFTPTYQQVHGPYKWKITIIDPTGIAPYDLSRVKVFYDNMEITKSIHLQFHVHYRKTENEKNEILELKMHDMKLSPLEDHQIRVDYICLNGQKISKYYQFPFVNDLHAMEVVQETAPFKVEPEILEAIKKASLEYNINPVLLTALIAQESSFNPFALSKAKALGLTQITDMTEKDIVRNFPNWPRYPRIQRISRKRLKEMIPKVVNSKNEWRLDAVKSVWGGAFYLAYLRDRLTVEKNRSILLKSGSEEDQILTEAMLASYNSGLNRVLSSIKKNEEEWLEQRETKEAKRYIRMILSYYGAFKSREDIDIRNGMRL